jgi:hypothetical protein
MQLQVSGMVLPEDTVETLRVGYTKSKDFCKERSYLAVLLILDNNKNSKFKDNSLDLLVHSEI